MVEVDVDALADVRKDSDAFFSVAESLESTGSSEYFGASDWEETRATDVAGGNAAGTPLALPLGIDDMDSTDIVEPETQREEEQTAVDDPEAKAAPKEAGAVQADEKENAGPQASPAVDSPKKTPTSSTAGEIEEEPAMAMQDTPVDERKTTSGSKSLSKKLSKIRSSFGKSGKKGKGEESPLAAEGEKPLLNEGIAGSEEKKPVVETHPKKKSASVTKRIKKMLSKAESGQKETQGTGETGKEQVASGVSSTEEGAAEKTLEETTSDDKQEQRQEEKGVEGEFTNPLVTGAVAGEAAAETAAATILPEDVSEAPQDLTAPENAADSAAAGEEKMSEQASQKVPPLPIGQSLGRSSISDDGGLFSGASSAAAIAAELKPHVSPRPSSRGTPRNSPHGRMTPPSGRRTPPAKPTVDVTIEATDAEHVKVTLSPVGEAPSQSEKPAEQQLNFFQRMFSLGRKGQEAKEEEKQMLDKSDEQEKDVGYSLTNRNVERLCVELDAALAEQGIDYKKNFDKSLDDFDNVVDFFIAMEASFGADESAPGIRETLAQDLGENHPLVLEIQRKQTLDEIRAIDEHVKASIDTQEEKHSDKIFTENPEDYKTSAEYYQSMQATAKSLGISLVPALTEKLGKEHPLVTALAVEEDTPEEADATVELVSSGGAAKPELPVSQGGRLADEASNAGRSKSRIRIVRDETSEPGGLCGCYCLRA
ncbi:hypothetical protein BSKO_00422 [Bryopsis sp. KO-2023]|nr:hypothetical protein BSKO_00422 [Bryopsis sp. KO-2023]